MGDVIAKPNAAAGKEDPYTHAQQLYSEYYPGHLSVSVMGSGIGSTVSSGATEKLMLTYNPHAPGASFILTAMCSRRRLK